MFDEKFIQDFMPSLIQIVKKYANDEHDEDELLSDGQLSMLEYLSGHCKSKNLKYNLYRHLDSKLKKISEQHNEDQVNVDVDKLIIVNVSDYNIEDVLDIMRDCLSTREFDIITSFYGIYTTDKTCRQIADEFNMDLERVKWLKKRAEMKIRKACDKSGICLYDLV